MTISRVSRGRRSGLALAAIVVGSLATEQALAGETDWSWLDGVYSGEIGARAWLGTGETGKSLYGLDGHTMLSRLTYRGLVGASGEIYGQINERNYFVKGVAGLGKLAMRGSLQDEDFATADFSPYSSTDSSLHAGDIGYVTLDGGAYVFQTPNSRLGLFAGYGYFRQVVNAYGCTQTATNTKVCTPSISDSTAAITQTNGWNALRLGVNGDMEFGQGWRIKGEAAVLPFVTLNGTDNHWLRTDFSGGIPEDGTGWGYQLEAMLDYTLANRLTVGVGGRYWHMQTSGSSHFESVTVGGGPQRVDWTTDYYGVTAHAGWQF